MNENPENDEEHDEVLHLANGDAAQEMCKILGYKPGDKVTNININFSTEPYVEVVVSRLMTKAEASALSILTKRLVETK